MNQVPLTADTLLLLLPLVLIQFGLFLFCAVKIFREGVENLNRWAWLLICLLFNFAGPIAFLLIGRKKAWR